MNQFVRVFATFSVPPTQLAQVDRVNAFFQGLEELIRESFTARDLEVDELQPCDGPPNGDILTHMREPRISDVPPPLDLTDEVEARIRSAIAEAETGLLEREPEQSPK